MLTSISVAVKQSMSLAVKKFISLAVKQSTSILVKWFTSLAVKWPTSSAVKQSTTLAVKYHKCHNLLGMKWNGAFYVDMALPFGVRSASYIFTCIANLVEWVAKQNYDVTFLMYYLHDFHTLAPPGSSVCQHNLDRSIDCFSKFGIPLHPDKQEGPSACLTIKGI